jgi:hypothetical protein
MLSGCWRGREGEPRRGRERARRGCGARNGGRTRRTRGGASINLSDVRSLDVETWPDYLTVPLDESTTLKILEQEDDPEEGRDFRSKH